MTKSYLANEIQRHELSEVWEQNIIAQRFSTRNIAKQLTYNLDIYHREKETLTHIIIFSFLGIIQLFFYALGAFLTRLRLRDVSSLRS